MHLPGDVPAADLPDVVHVPAHPEGAVVAVDVRGAGRRHRRGDRRHGAAARAEERHQAEEEGQSNSRSRKQ